MTPSARRLASLAGSQRSHAQADELLCELSGLNFGAKRIERTTRAAGDDDLAKAWAKKPHAMLKAGRHDDYWNARIARLAAWAA